MASVPEVVAPVPEVVAPVPEVVVVAPEVVVVASVPEVVVVAPEVVVVAPVPEVVAPVPEAVALGSFFGFFGFFARVVPEVVASVPDVVVVAPVVVAPVVVVWFLRWFVVPEVVAPVPEVVAPVEGCWLVSVLFVVEPLESGSATATAPPAPPISKPAASTQTPAAKRKCDKPTICSPQPQDSSPAFQRLQNCRIIRPSDLRKSQTRYPAVNSQQQTIPTTLDVQSARSGSANDACAQRRRPWRSQSVNDSQK